MSVRRLHHDQPATFAFTPANTEWVERQIAKYPDGRQASAVIPILWRGQEQEGWVTRPMIEEVARLLGMAEIRVLEIATFYFMFQLQPVGSVAHIQICGTTSCMICGAEDLVSVCREKIAPNPHQISKDGKFSWEEVECLGACANAPMAQIGKDYFEDLTSESFGTLIDTLAGGTVPRPGPQNGRWASEPADGLTSLHGETAHVANASVDIALQIGDTVKRIDGTDKLPRWDTVRSEANSPAGPAPGGAKVLGAEISGAEISGAEISGADAAEESTQPSVPEKPADSTDGGPPPDQSKPELLSGARGGKPDDLKRIRGIGPKLEALCNALGVWHFDQISSWSDAETAWVDFHLQGFKGRIVRDDWVAQAKVLARDKS